MLGPMMENLYKSQRTCYDCEAFTGGSMRVASPRPSFLDFGAAAVV